MATDTTTPELGPFPGRLGPHTSAAIERLKTGQPGDTITPRQMMEIIGRRCERGSLGCGNVYSAMRHVRDNYHVTWAWDRGLKAWRCLTASERVSFQKGYVRRSRRSARTGLKIGETVDRKELTTEEARDHDLNRISLAMVHMMGQTTFRKRLVAAECAGHFTEPDRAKLIELMGGKST